MTDCMSISWKRILLASAYRADRSDPENPCVRSEQCVRMVVVISLSCSLYVKVGSDSRSSCAVSFLSMSRRSELVGFETCIES